MPARLTPQGLLVLSWNFQRSRWESSLHELRLQDLYRVTDIQPGMTISELFDLADVSSELKQFFGELCWCDIEAVHRRPRLPLEEVTVYPDYKSARQHVGGESAEYVELEKWFQVPATAGDQAERDSITTKLSVHYQFWAGRDGAERELIASPALGTPDAHHRSGLDALFGTAVTLPFKLSPTAQIAEVQDYGQRQEVPVGFTLLEILSAIYYALGEAPEHMNAEQPRVELEQALRDIFPELREDDEPPWQSSL
jgi:hypothetical protein